MRVLSAALFAVLLAAGFALPARTGESLTARQTHGLCACFAPGTSDEYIEQFLARLSGGARYSHYGRWSHTATDGSTGPDGTPVTLTYSFVPDGTIAVPDGVLGPGITSFENVLHATMDARFGSRSAWQDLFRDTLERWSEQTGVRLVEEPSDDSAIWPTSDGQLGVRGDVRIVSLAEDGPNGVLAYNFFPDFGDMALDKDENWAAAANDYRFLRNVLLHELGHGLGLQHVLPRDGTKLMEAYLNLNFTGPQDDDLRGAGVFYGDWLESNETLAASSDLGPLQTPHVVTGLNLHGPYDRDWLRFSAPAGTWLALEAAPLGAAYSVSPDPGSPAPADTTAIFPLRVELYDDSGDLLRSATAGAAGQSAATLPIALPGGNSAFRARVSTTATASGIQRYKLTVTNSSSPLRSLAVASVPMHDVTCTASPADAAGRTSATSPAALVYADGQSVTLTAPATHGSASFSHWLIGSTAQPAGQRTVSLTLTADRAVTAVYIVGFNVDAGPDEEIVRGERVTLAAEAESGSAPYSYRWSPTTGLSNANMHNPVASPTATTTYTVTATDSAGQQVSDSLTVRVLDPLVAEAGESRIVVAGRPFTLYAEAAGGSPPYRFEWQPPIVSGSPTGQTFSATIDLPTTFTLTVTDDRGRRATDTVHFDVAEPLVVLLGDDQTIAAGTMVSLFAQVSGGRPPYSYAWLPPALFGPNNSPSAVFTPTGSTLVGVTVNDASGQTATDERRVTVLPPLHVSATSSRHSVAPGGQVLLQAIVSGAAPPMSIAWEPPDQCETPWEAQTLATLREPTTFFVRVTDALGRQAGAQVEVLIDEDAPSADDLAQPRSPCGPGLFIVLPIMLASCLPTRAVRRAWARAIRPN